MLEVRQAVVRFGVKTAVDGFDLRVADGHVVAVLGPSGCGKSTLLRAIAGLEPLAAGDVLWDGRSVVGVPPHRRGFGLMFQDYSLFPHKTVAGNVGFGLRMAGLSGSDLRDRVGAALDLVGMAGYEERTIGNLSGGEQQRVALARALAPEPRLLMLDEPLGALDRTLRERLVVELGELFAGLGITAIYVTHDQEEAFSVADQVVVMREGKVAQEGTPEEVYRRPADEWAARFLGFANVIEAEVREGTAVSEWGSTVVTWGRLRGTSSLEPRTAGAGEVSYQGAGASDGVAVVLPPDAVAVDPAGPIGGLVQSRTFRGGHYLLLVQVEDGPLLEVEVPGGPVGAPGRTVRLRVIEGRAVLLEA